MKLAITRNEEAYSTRMNDCTGKMTGAFLSFIRNLVKEIGEVTDKKNCTFGIGVIPKDLPDTSSYDVFEIPDYIGYLILEYHRNLKENFVRVNKVVPSEQSELNPS